MNKKEQLIGGVMAILATFLTIVSGAICIRIAVHVEPRWLAIVVLFVPPLALVAILFPVANALKRRANRVRN